VYLHQQLRRAASRANDLLIQSPGSPYLPKVVHVEAILLVLPMDAAEAIHHLPNNF